MTTGERIKSIRQRHKLSQEAFAARLPNVSRGAVGNWERDQGIKRENLEEIATRFAVSFEWLATGRGRSELTELTRVPEGAEFPPDPDFSDNPAALEAARRGALKHLGAGEIIERDVRGGLGPGGYGSVININGEPVDQVKATWTFPAQFIHAELSAREPDLDILAVDGDSMIPTLYPGDRVLVHRRLTSPAPDGVFAIDDGIGVSVKRLQIVRGSAPLQVRIKSDNPAHETDVVMADDLKVIGRVILKLSKL